MNQQLLELLNKTVLLDEDVRGRLLHANWKGLEHEVNRLSNTVLTMVEMNLLNVVDKVIQNNLDRFE